MVDDDTFVWTGGHNLERLRGPGTYNRAQYCRTTSVHTPVEKGLNLPPSSPQRTHVPILQTANYRAMVHETKGTWM